MKFQPTKTLMIALNDGFAIRNVLQNDVYRHLAASGLALVLVTPNADDPVFQERYRGEHVSFEPLPYDRYRTYMERSRAQMILKNVHWFTLNDRYDISSADGWYRNVHQRERRCDRFVDQVRNVIEDVLIAVLRKSKLLRRFLVWLECVFFTPSYLKNVFERYRPDWLLVTGLGYWNYDQLVMREAKRHGTRVMTLVQSWDNTSTRGMRVAPVDTVIAWTEVMKRELTTLHDFKADDVLVGGAAQFDHHFRPALIQPRDDFYRTFKLDPDRPIIFFATKSPTGFPWNPDMTEILARAINDNRLIKPCQLVVRIHPIHFRRKDGILRFKKLFDRYDDVAKRYAHVTYNIPRILSDEVAFDMPEQELSDVASLLQYSSVLVNMFSTLNIEASIHDVPIVNIAFEGPTRQEKKRPRDDIRIDEMQTHNQRIVQSGGVRVVYNEASLIKEINAYLADPSRDREGRRRIVEQECGPHHGQAGRAIGELIVSLCTGSR